MKNKVILITGGTSGVGLEAASFFLEKGNSVIVLGRNTTKLNFLHSKYNKTLTSYSCDIKNYTEVSKVFNQINNIDILINNASIFKSKPFIQFTPEEINDIIDINLKGTIYCTLEALKKLNKGRIINIGSVSGTHGIENQTIYSATKFGLMGFADSLSQEIHRKNILMTTICPGGINTPLWNLDNPYQGEVTDLLSPKDIVNTINYIINSPDNVVIKTIKLFPNCEFH